MIGFGTLPKVTVPSDDGLNGWRRQELVWALRWLAADPEAAIAAYDGIIVADEIALDLNHWYEVSREWGLLDEPTAEALRVIDDTFDAMSDVGPHLWTDDAICNSAEWAAQRERARAALVRLGEPRADLDIGRPRPGGSTYVRG